MLAVLEGGLSGRPSNIVFYATSTAPCMPRQMIENEEEQCNPSEAAEEKISLSDRFGRGLAFILSIKTLSGND